MQINSQDRQKLRKLNAITLFTQIKITNTKYEFVI